MFVACYQQRAKGMQVYICVNSKSNFWSDIKNLTFCSNLLIKSNHLLLPRVPCSAFYETKVSGNKEKDLLRKSFLAKLTQNMSRRKTIFLSAAGWGHFWKWNENSKHPWCFARVVLGKHQLNLQLCIKYYRKITELRL